MKKVERWLVYCCLLFTFISEMLLSPFFPQLFSSYFQVDGVQATSLFIICCRLIGIVMTPIWAKVAEWIPLRKLITSALMAMTGCKLLIPNAHSFEEFLVISLVLLFFQSSIYILYPVMIASCKKEDEKVKTTTTYLFLFHGSVIVAGIIGSFIINWSFPLDSYYLFAIIDLVLAAACYFLLSTRYSFSSKGKIRNKEDLSHAGKWQGEFLIYLFIVLLFFIGHHTIRPYFTAFLDRTYTLSKQGLSLLYVMPSLVAIILQFLLPKRYLQSHIKMIFICITAVTGGLLYIQVLVEDIWLFVFFRIMYGICFFVSLAAIDVLFFKMRMGKESPLSYSLVTSVQNIALLISPIAALTMVEHDGGEGPFFFSGFLLICSALLAFLFSISTHKASLYQIKKGVGHSENK